MIWLGEPDTRLPKIKSSYLHTIFAKRDICKTAQCTMWLSIALELSKVLKSEGVSQFWSKSDNSSSDWWKSVPKLKENNPILFLFQSERCILYQPGRTCCVGNPHELNVVRHQEYEKTRKTTAWPSDRTGYIMQSDWMEVWPQLSGSCRRFFANNPDKSDNPDRPSKSDRSSNPEKPDKSADETACRFSAQASSRSYNVHQPHGVASASWQSKIHAKQICRIFLPASQLSSQISWSQLRFKEFCLSSHSYFLWHTVAIFWDTQSVFSVTNNS